MTLVLIGLLWFAGLLAWLLTARRPEHRPIALVLSAGLALDALLHAYDVAALAPLRAELGTAAPWTGWARVAGVASDALVIAWPAALVAAALVVYLGRRPWAAFAAWLAAVAVLAVLPSALVAVETVGALAAFAISVGWHATTTKPGNSAQLVLAFVTLAEAVALLGSWRLGPFDHWPISQALYSMTLVIIIAAQGRMLCSPRLQLSQ